MPWLQRWGQTRSLAVAMHAVCRRPCLQLRSWGPACMNVTDVGASDSSLSTFTLSAAFAVVMALKPAGTVVGVRLGAVQIGTCTQMLGCGTTTALWTFKLRVARAMLQRSAFLVTLPARMPSPCNKHTCRGLARCTARPGHSRAHQGPGERPVVALRRRNRGVHWGQPHRRFPRGPWERRRGSWRRRRG